MPLVLIFLNALCVIARSYSMRAGQSHRRDLTNQTLSDVLV